MDLSFITVLFLLRIFHGNAVPEQGIGEPEATSRGRLVSASTTMTTAWDIPRNPLTDSTLAASADRDRITKGYILFMQTPEKAPKFAPNRLACGNCHLNGGQRERALPLVGVAGVFPEFNKREGRSFSLEDRIVGCFMRSENATGYRADGRDSSSGPDSSLYPGVRSEEVGALASYIVWLSEGIRAGETLPWRGRNTLHADSLIPVERLNTERGRALFVENCRSCHGEDGQGVQIGDKRAGPLWGPHSWNDGAGAARIYTLAGIIRYAMPYLNPGSLTDEQAQQIAAFINSMPRPEYPLKRSDYRQGGIPPDAVYYRNLTAPNPR
ncbi:MAG TPA: c-type cytochrome [Bacteroidota bacterium]|nr:c-type cytochrome [Bacteroidota bacterium]